MTGDDYFWEIIDFKSTLFRKKKFLDIKRRLYKKCFIKNDRHPKNDNNDFDNKEEKNSKKFILQSIMFKRQGL